jgi:integrase
MSGLKAQPRDVVHYIACPYPRIPEFWERLSTHTDTVMMSLRWAILNAARPKEARRLRWDWIDTSNRVVTIPGAEMKGGREHRIPYSAASAVLLEIMREVRTCDWVFPNPQNQPYSTASFAGLPRQVMPDIKGITAHGFRSSFADWVSEGTVFEPDMIEIALAHQVGDKVVAAYRRGDLWRSAAP